MKRLYLCGSLVLAVCLLAYVGPGHLESSAVVAEPTPDALAANYTKDVRPLLTQYCQKCHSDKRAEADLDFTQFTTLADVRKSTRVWLKIAEMLDSAQMPPKDAKQPTEDERTRLRTWVRSFLEQEAKAHAGDPGRVVLRRLSNAEYTYTVRDLTGVESLQPAREFPVDGAAGEGFTNTGDALVMSSTLLTKYLDAAKGIAAHAVLLPDGIRFSPHTTRRDQTNEYLTQIRTLYGLYSDPTGGTKVNLQGLVWDAKDGGRLPVEKYVAATLSERDALRTGKKTFANVAKERGLSAKYLELLWNAFNDPTPAMLLDDLRLRWRNAKPDEAAAVTADIVQWQNALWKFSSVGHIGKLDGPKAWLEPVDPLVAQQELKWKVPATEAGEVTFYLVAADAGDGNEHDYVVWQQPKFVAAGKPELLLRDVRQQSQALTTLRASVVADTAKYLRAAGDAAAAKAETDVTALAKKHQLDAEVLRAWLDLLGIGASGPVKIEGLFTNKLTNGGNYKFVQGWGSNDTPSIIANSSAQHVRIPGNLKPHSVAVHPAPKQNVLVGWQSPLAGKVRVELKVAHAHPECGNGVTWALEQRRGTTRQRLAAGVAQGGTPPKIDPIDKLSVQVGDVLSVVIGPRDGNHSCDLTAIDLIITAGEQSWNLASEVSPDVLAGNPHADRYKNDKVWHFYAEPITTASNAGFIIPSGSLLDKWRTAEKSEDKAKLATEVQQLLSAAAPPAQDAPNATLHRQLTALSGPLFARLRDRAVQQPATPSETAHKWGLDPASFGKHPNGKGVVAPASLCVKAPAVVEVRVPADLVAGYELVTTGTLHADSQDKASVQLQVATTKPEARTPLRPGVPILAAPAGAARQRIATGFEAFRQLFPSAVCYTKIVPVDEVVTLTLYYREDAHLIRLMLNDAERKQLDRLWEELHYVSQDAFGLVDAYKQLMEYATQDSNPKLFEPLRKPIYERAEAFRKQLVDTEPKHRTAMLEFAERAWRRPLSKGEKDDLLALYQKLRAQELPHEEAIRLTLARVLISSAFLYKLEKPGTGAQATAITDWELANRLSYFLWSSAPDAELRAAAAAGKLHNDDVLVAQMKRMVQDPRVRRLATEFGCQWLHIRGFDEMNEKSERHFPTFTGLRAAMYEESIQFFTDLFQNDRTVSSILDSDYTFLNEALAKHYGIPGVTGTHWRRVEGVKKYGRGGILGQSTTLATQAGASRTSPILRGNWVSEVLLGEKLPRPPKGVPQLPDDEAQTEGLTVRQLVEKHSSDPKCAVCHKRIDAYGFALEGFDAIGRRRDKDLANRPIDTQAKTADGAKFDGIDGLRDYLLSQRREAFVRQFCKKLLGYALGRAVQLSDEPLLTEMQTALAKNDYRVNVALERIVRSKQFREIRGSKYAADE